MKSETINELAAALAKAQGQIKDAVKDSKNPFFKSSYADLSSTWTACRSALSSNGLSIAQVIDTTEQGMILTTTLMHSSGQWLSGNIAIVPVKADPQGIGSAITYMRRYALAAMVGVAPTDDDDGNEASQHKTESTAARHEPPEPPEPMGNGHEEPEPATNTLAGARARVVKHAKAAQAMVSALSQTNHEDDARKLDGVVVKARKDYMSLKSISEVHKLADQLKAEVDHAQVILTQPQA